MKVVKDVLPTKEEKRNMFDVFKKEESRPKKYDGKVELKVSKPEYEFIVSVARRLKGYTPFVKEAIENFKSLEELRVPKSDEGAKPWFTFEYEEPFKEGLKQKAQECGLSLEEFVRAVVWTKAKLESEKMEERGKRAKESQRVSRGYTVPVNLRGEFLKRYEEKYGEVKSSEQAFNGILDIINKDLNE